jgi:hypothetical protein
MSLPIGVSQNRPPFLGGEGREVALRPVLDFFEEDEKMVKVNALVWGLSAPEKVDGRKREATRGLYGSELVVADLADGMLPHFLYPWKPIWRCTGSGQAYQLRVIRLGHHGGHASLGLFSVATGYPYH